MTEQEAQRWLEEKLGVSRETMRRLQEFRKFLLLEAEKQNLISAATREHIWVRHILDSAQLLLHLPKNMKESKWLDLGSGAGFPGIVAALLGAGPVTLVESRARRIDYLGRAIDHLGLEGYASVAGMRLEKLETRKYGVISARAFAPLPKLLKLAARFSTENSCWLLPKGRNAAKELDEVQRQKEWRGRLDFRLEPSLTDAEAGILTGRLLEDSSQKRDRR